MKTKPLLLSGLTAIALCYGAFWVWDHIPEVDPDPANSPIENMSMIKGKSVPLTQAVADPAGIVFLPDSETYLVSTDGRELIELSADFLTVLSAITLPASPFGIGDTEGVTYLGNGKAAVIGETGVVLLMSRDGKGWKETERFPITGFKAGSQLGSATYDPATQTLYTAQKKGEKILYKININDRTVEVFSMTLSSDVQERSGRKWQELTIAGLQFHKGRLYGISEAFSSLLVIDPNGSVDTVLGLTGINESSGITVKDGVLTLVGDAEGYLPPPPIYLLDPSAIQEITL
jgi:uncharacterized protein YjiK